MTSWEVVLTYPNGHVQPSGYRFADDAEAEAYRASVLDRMRGGFVAPATVHLAERIEPANYRWTDGGLILL